MIHLFGSIFGNAKKRREERGRREAEREKWNADTTFTKDERIVTDIIVKCDFSKCKFDNYHEYMSLKFYHNNLKLHLQTNNTDDADGKWMKITISRRDNFHDLKSFGIGSEKAKMISKMIKDKLEAYRENSIVSELNKKGSVPGQCVYCGTHNEKGRTNCVNCGGVL